MNKYEKIFGDWFRYVEPFLVSDTFRDIGLKLKSRVNEGYRIFPIFDDMFRAFRECRYKDLKVVILTTNSYKDKIDGLAFSTQEKFIGDFPETQQVIFDYIEEAYYNGLYLERQSDLSRWANQGVLLLNCDLSYEKGKQKEHLKLWMPFIEYLMAVINEFHKNCIFVLCGQEALKYKPYIDEQKHKVMLIEHPYNSVKERREWKEDFIFEKVDVVCKKFFKNKINWK